MGCQNEYSTWALALMVEDAVTNITLIEEKLNLNRLRHTPPNFVAFFLFSISIIIKLMVEFRND